jgi:hypothetical protein
MRDERAALVPLRAPPSINAWEEVSMTNGTKTLNKTTALAQNQKAIEGVDKYLAHTKSLVLAGTTYTPASLTAVLQAEIDGDKAVDEGRAQFRQQVVAARLARSKGSAMRKMLKTYVLNTFGSDAVQTLEDFGFAPPKPTGPRTVKSKAQAVGKAEATRAAHKGTNGAQVPAVPAAPAQAAVVAAPLKQ